jgi:hypothetical protein
MTSAHHSSKFALLLLFAILWFPKSATAQQHEIQIMVNGPWAYVATPTPTPPAPPATTIIATPSITNHKLVIFPGEDADQFPRAPAGSEVSMKGAYQLAFQGVNLADCSLIPPKSATPEPSPFPVTVSSNAANSVITGSLNGFAITLPTPCYATNFADSRSRIDPTTIDPDPHKSPAEAEYTIWRVLHYSVDTPGTATASITGGAQPRTVPFQANDIQDVPAISIVMGDPHGNDTNIRCDSLSVDSFQQEAQLFNNLKLHVQFPRLVAPGTQTHDYKPDCIDNSHSLAAEKLTPALKQIDTIEAFLTGAGVAPKNIRDTFASLEAVIRSLQPPDRKPPKNVADELKLVCRKLFLEKDRSDCFSDIQAPAMKKPLRQTRKYLDSMTAAGAGDCRGAQLDVTVQ